MVIIAAFAYHWPKVLRTPKKVPRPIPSDICRRAQATKLLLIALAVSWLDSCGGRVFSSTDDRFDASGTGGSVHQDGGTSPEADASLDSPSADATTQHDDDALEIFTQHWTTVIRTRNGEYHAWGRRAYLGAEPRDPESPFRRLVVPDGVRHGVIGINFLCVLLNQGDVWCATGGGGASQAKQGVPLAKVTQVPGRAVSLEAGLFSPFVVVAEEPTTIYGWSDWGQDDATVVSVSVPTDIASVAPGGNHCAALTQGGDVYWWGQYSGFMESGQTSGTVYSKEPVQLEGLSGVKQLVSGFYHTCALTKSGRVLCWGKGDDHQLGHQVPWQCEAGDCLMAVEEAVLPESEMFVKLATKDTLTVALSASGSLWVWGGSNDEDCPDAGFCGVTPQRVEEIDDAVDVAVGELHICVIRKDFSVWCLGDNTYDQAWPYDSGGSVPAPQRVWPPV